MNWKYIKKIKDNNVFEQIELEKNITIPINLKEIISRYNGGRPQNNIFDTETTKERVLHSMISYNKEDRVNIFMFIDLFDKKMVPFAVTPFGDVICLNIVCNDIQLYLHELDICEKICNSIEEFFDELYSDND